MRKLLLFFFLFLIYKSSICQTLKVSTDFESGSAKVLSLNQETQTIRITPAGDPKRGMPNWWYLRIDGVEMNKPLTLEVAAIEEPIPMGPLGRKIAKLSPSWTWPAQAAFSTDGKTWKHTTEGKKTGQLMVYTVESATGSVWIAWGPPFTASDAGQLLQQVSKTYSYTQFFTLSKSREGRNIPALKIAEGKKALSQRPAIWVQARQHAWEVGGSWVAVGLINWLVSDDPRAIWLRQNAEIYVVPVMDADHVATGDGGKHAFPQDHNRDWTKTPHWPEVEAAQNYIRALTKENRMNIFLDLHNPAASDKQQTMYVLDKSYMNKDAFPRYQRFVELMIEKFGEIKQHVDNNPKPPVLTPEEFVSEVWVLENANSNTIGFCIETPWNLPKGTIDGYATVGQNIGQVIHKLLLEESSR